MVLVLQLFEQLQDLKLDRHVERRGRLVGNEELRRAGERDGDHDALTHTAGKLMRELIDAPLRIGDADCGQQADRLGARRFFVHAPVAQKVFHDLPSDGHGRIERGQRVLKDDGDLAPAKALQLFPAHGQNIGAVKTDLAPRQDLAGGLDQAQDALARDGLAAAGFAHEGDRLLPADVHVHAAHGLYLALIAVEADAQVSYFQKLFHAGPHFLNRGSRAFLSPSPKRLNASTRMQSTSAGKMSWLTWEFITA